MLSVILRTSNRKIFLALIAGKSPATKAIARTFLPGAIDCLDCSLVSALLDTGISPDSCVNDLRQRPLQIAISKQSKEMMELLLGHGGGADVNVNLHLIRYSYCNRSTPLKAAVKTGRLDLVQLLLRAEALVNDLEPRREISALQIAAATGKFELVRLLLEAEADVNAPPYDHCGETALQAAARNGNIEVVQLLLDYGADVNAPCATYGRTALQSAAHGGRMDVTQRLLLYGANDVLSALESAGQSRNDQIVDYLFRYRMESHGIVDDTFGRTALRAATECGDFDLVQTLLVCGVSVDAPPADADISWHTALQIAAHHGHIKIAELLLSYKADINAPALPRPDFSEGTATALQEAVGENHMQLVLIFLNHGADVNAPAAHGRMTAPVAAANQGDLEMFQLLLDHGADIRDQGASVVIEAVGSVSLEFLRFLLNTWTDASGDDLEWTVNTCNETALEIAVDEHDTELIRLLLEYDADDAYSALRRAARYGDTEIVELLEASGAADGDPSALVSAAEADSLDVLNLCLRQQTTAHDRAEALQMAARRGSIDAVQLLLDHGADVNAAPLASICDDANDPFGRALQAAAGRGDLQMVRLLLEAGADVEVKEPHPDEKATALQFAAIAGSMSVVTELVQEGADVFAPAVGVHGRTAIEGAAEHGRLDIVQLLLNLGVEVAGSRAIQFARKEGHDGVVALLEEA